MASLTDDAIARIQQMIVSGELQPGQRLPPEKELSESLGLSRNSLREAVKALELIRVLDVRRGDGTYVTSLEPTVLLEAVSFVVDMHHDRSLVDLLEVRRILEPASAVLATARASEQQIDELATLMVAVDDSTGVEDLVAHDLLFHSTIATIGGNQYLSGLLDALSSKTVRVRVWRGLTQNGSVQRTLDEHAAIVDAIRRRDPQLVQSLVVAHVEGVERWLRRSLD
ncbi:FadR/GntR family transcriptional regulator [Curtobacterium sp. SP.BCp]|uniref:FadR/GntR family transcriptional regulator n=1 Tax=unclassified Curtobacterium TaxID=257496 RepID=UPI0025B30379|nr:FadR/GntR family transcriptional regulator [Curtobacterium sp. 458]WJX98646.1 FadR/GntR family transcriptional regulator [Curtobacterium sp. 458]